LKSKLKICIVDYGIGNIKAFKNIYKVTAPTIETKKKMISEKIVQEDKIILLRDPILSPKKINILQREEKEEKFKDYYISVGRLTNQKNYEFLIDCFFKLIKKDKEIKLVILGEGELRQVLEKKINNLNMNDNIFLLGYHINI